MQGLHEFLLPEEFREASSLLESRGLELPENITFGLGMYEEGELVGAGFLASNVICGIGVAQHHESSGISAAVVTGLVQRALAEGRRTLLLFTKPGEAQKFAGLGFSPLVATTDAALLEWGTPGYADWARAAKAHMETHAEGLGFTASSALVPLGAAVMNANPFTLGHRHLVEKMLEKCARAVIFVVEEEASAFPFAARLRLVAEGLVDMPKALVLPGGPYMVSRASFPSYFTGKTKHAAVYAGLDCAMFASKIAPDLGIGLRAIGSEPYCEVTALYNETMRNVLPRYGIACLEVPRLETADGVAVSASAVREALARNARGRLQALAPPSTLAFLDGPEGAAIAERIRNAASRH